MCNDESLMNHGYFSGPLCVPRPFHISLSKYSAQVRWILARNYEMDVMVTGTDWMKLII